MTAIRLLLTTLIVILSGGRALAYEVPPPPSVPVEITFQSDGQSQSIRGELIFKAMPIIGRTKSGQTGKPTQVSIKQFVPKKNGEIWLVRDPEGGPTGFIFHDYTGDTPLQLRFQTIPVVLSDEGELQTAMDLTDAEAAAQAALEGYDDMLETVGEEPPEPAEAQPDADPKQDDEPAVKLGLTELGDIRRIAVEDIQRITFDVPRGYQREKPRGRFVGYSKAAEGNQGRTKVLAATFLGGYHDERFTVGTFLPDGQIIVGGPFSDLMFLDDKHRPKVIGTDSAAIGAEQRTTPTFFQFNEDMTELRQVVRLPWGVGSLEEMVLADDGGLIFTGTAGPGLADLEEAAGHRDVIENPGRVAWAAQRNRDPGPDGFVIRLSPDHSKVEWVVRTKHRRVKIGLRHDDRVLVERHLDYFLIEPNGKVGPGPQLSDRISTSRRAPMAVSREDGSYFLGGDYHSGTGLEPWRCPYLYKVNADGKVEWTAWSWTGPIVGNDRLRLVSDSAVRLIKIDPQGNLIIRGWSDGGNSVFLRQPYDLHKSVPTTDFAGSIWGAGVLSVAYLIRVDSKTMDVIGMRRWLSYLPYDDLPNSAGVRDFVGTEAGPIAATGGAAFALIETHDAWVTPWWIEYQTNEFARPKGGSYFALFSNDFRKLLFSSILPGVGDQQMASHGNRVLVFGHAKPVHGSYGSDHTPILKNAIQSEHAGGKTDAYLMLIDTQGEPDPPTIPQRTWQE